MSLFGKRESTLEMLVDGKFVCTECNKLLHLANYTPLVAGQCEHCHKVNFIPMKVGDFFLIGPLGGGGMGAVYRSLRVNTTEEYAVKILPRGGLTDADLIGNLQSEAQVANALRSHPCLANLVDSGFADGEHYMAMEFIKGERLDSHIERLSKLPEFDVLLIGLRLLSALAHIYSCGYLFRDMKPQNVIVTADAGAFLFDFGICMSLEDSLIDHGDTIVGSPIYFPPERILGEGERGCSEIYSLGMVLYFAISGSNYFTAKEIDAIARQHVRNARLSTMEHKLKDISPDIATIIDRMIRRPMDERYQTFAEVERDMTRSLQTRLNPASAA